MALIIDDVAVVLVEAAKTTEAVESVQAATSVNAISETDLTAVAGDFSNTESFEVSNTDLNDKIPSSGELESAKDLSNDTNVFYDEFPGNTIEQETTGTTNTNVFYDEYPGDMTEQETTGTTDTPTNTEVEKVPEDYDSYCETRNSGGSYKDIRDEGWGWNDEPPHEVHHMPADSASNLERNDGPAIAMDYKDHQQTASCGSSREAKEYRAQQQALIKEGKFREALQMDIDDLHDKFGDKYDKAISQMLEYVDKLEKEGKI